VTATTACTSEPLAPGETDDFGTSGAAGEPGQTPLAPLVVLSRVRISSNPDAEHHQQAEAEVDFGRDEVARATLRIKLESPCFPFAGWADQEIPSSHRWPLLCDAFDRGLSLTLDPGGEDDTEAAPALELVRAVTPFGGPLELTQDITDIVNGLPGPHRLRLRIDTWADPDGQVSGAEGEWLADVELELEPGPAPRRVLAVLPLVYESQTEPETDPVIFNVPNGTRTGRLEYRVTGHGAVPELGCLGPAEEFCQRTHELRLGGKLIELVPWRSDCAQLCTLTENTAELGPAQYCAENPCGAIESVRASRSNWCPGSMTGPFVVEDPTLALPGQHSVRRTIPELHEGGSWLVSLSYIAFD
jgi:hypothetical protein